MSAISIELRSTRLGRQIGGILLVSGTTIGAGMLTIPVLTGTAGFYPSALVLIAYWAVMLCTALLFLEANLWFHKPVNLITMARHTLGGSAQIATWALYLLLLYALTAAYLAGTGSMVADLIHDLTGYQLPQYAQTFPFLAIFGGCIYFGTRPVDYINRILMVGLSLSYFCLISGALGHISPVLLSRMELSSVWMAIPVISTSYGFHIIIPTLTTYLDRDLKALKRVILIGSAIPLVIYLVWEYAVLGVVPAAHLADALRLGEGATRSLGAIVQTPWIGLGGQLFAFFAIVTSFLGVGLSLFHFFADGLAIEQTPQGKALTAFLTFVVPIGFVIFFPRGFIMALEYAGICVALLLGILPVLMVWRGRKLYPNALYQVSGGTPLLALLFTCFLGVLVLMIFKLIQ